MSLARRLKFQQILEELLGSDNVYFQPPDSVKIKYDAIVYGLDYMAAGHGGNAPYTVDKRYQVTSITSDPDSGLPDKLARLPKSTFIRSFKQDGLNHTIFAIYF